MTGLTPTQKKIHEVAMEYFLRDGFRKASLRQIVADAGFTLGAFYGYYKSKEELFEALVVDVANGIIEEVSKMGAGFQKYDSKERLDHMVEVFDLGLSDLLDYLLSHIDETRLLLKCSQGTKYENFLERLMDRNLELMKDMTGDEFPLNPLAAKLLVNSYFNLLGDAVLSGESREEIADAMKDIEKLYAGGMVSLMKG
ncbi:MAG: TetR/AcrR family transcriptional regulator [Lachnospiraceae bacterium]|nr:TetR/AcrR family transcriptional regulator [Lachnospiraceae bacterium]